MGTPTASWPTYNTEVIRTDGMIGRVVETVDDDDKVAVQFSGRMYAVLIPRASLKPHGTGAAPTLATSE